MKKIMAVIIDLVEAKFWGELVIQFKAGKPIRVTKTEIQKLDDENEQQEKTQ